MGALRRLGRRFRGCTLIELVVVVVLLVMICSHGVVLSPTGATELGARRLERAGEAFFARHPGAKRCSMDRLVREGFYEGTPVDAWRRSFWFECVRDRVRVVSAGEDGELGTCDDVRPGVPASCGLAE